MCVDRSIPRSSCQIFVIFVGNVLLFFTDIFFGKSEVDHEYLGNVVLSAYQKIIWFYVSMKNASWVNKFD